MPYQVDEAEARARRDRLVAVHELVAEERAERFVGRTLDVLVEASDELGAVGRPYRETPETDGEVPLPVCDVPAGMMAPVRVETVDGVDLVGAPALLSPRVDTRG
jgi:ribosomal protein S12 methylthiotransferase